MTTLLWRFLVLLMVGLSTKEVLAQVSVTLEELEEATLVMAQGDLAKAEKLMSITLNKGNALAKPLLQLQALYFVERESTDKAIDAVTALELRYPNHADTFAFSSEVWRSIGHQASIFSKLGYYRRAVESKIKAGELAPDSARYLTLKASALGQSKKYGGTPELQSEITEKIVKLDVKWGYIAQINLAQNQDDFALATQLAKSAAKQFPQDFDILHRIAKLHWTMGQRRMAQDYFYLSCQQKVEQQWQTQLDWRNACHQVVDFAVEHELQPDKAVLAIENLLQHHRLLTADNFVLLQTYFQLHPQQQAAHVIQLLKQFAENADQTRLRRKAITLYSSVTDGVIG